MYGTMAGNLMGIAYYAVYQILGIFFAGLFLKKEKKEFQLLLGSITGTVAFQWFPILTSMVMDFTVESHLVALGLVIILFAVVMFVKPVKKATFDGEQKGDGMMASLQAFGGSLREAPFFWGIMVITYIFFLVLLFSHSIPMGEGGEIRTGQCTYGDMNMHLGFITSITQQKDFPPEYSILPGTRLAYPFLCDSVSSSVYVFGASLRVAYMVPMMVAILQAFLGFYCLAEVVLKSKAKSLLAWVLFFFNGGFGFVYFFDMYLNNHENFTRIFTEFYETPTNLVGNNVRWSNVIVDMLLPQRATLFGWAVLFGVLALLYRAMEEKSTRYFVLVAILGGALPLIHTHSFLALAMVCVVWVTGYMLALTGVDMEANNRSAAILIPFGLVLMSILQASESFKGNISQTGPIMVAIVIVIAVATILYLIYKVVTQNKFKEMFMTWGLLLIIVLALALPQLINWTFRQVGSGESLRGLFNWANNEDQYVWFYIKNLGFTAIMAVPAMIYAKRKKFFVAAPALFIWAIAEFMVFQPNPYDNNKLLYVAYGLLLLLSADFMGDIFKKIFENKKIGACVLGACVIFVCTISAVLTMGREYNSDYELYSADQVALCEYVEDNTDPHDVILTNNRHNNAVASLTGRNIVCGSSSFLYYHGLDYSVQENDARTMYETPSIDLLKQYNVKYILVGPEERSSYTVDEASIQAMCDVVFSQNDVVLYKVRY